MTVRTHREASLLVVTIDRPEVRKPVDGPTAQSLTAAFEGLDAACSARDVPCAA